MDLRKRERKKRIRMEKEYEEHVRKRERLRMFLTYLRQILPLVRECESKGRLP